MLIHNNGQLLLMISKPLSRNPHHAYNLSGPYYSHGTSIRLSIYQ